MNVLSLFDGISCVQLALLRAGIKVENYYASEIDKFAIQVTQKNFPNTIQLGDVTRINLESLPKIDILVGGSPCQGFSFAGKQLAFEDPRSKLIFEFFRIKKYLESKNPNLLFLLENVKMKKQHENVISDYLGIQPIVINSASVSAQNRVRNYWTNITVQQPKNKNLVLKDILETNVDERYYLTKEQIDRGLYKAKGKIWKTGNRMGNMDFPNNLNKKAKTLTTVNTLGGRETNHVEQINKNYSIRRLTPIECERLQNLPDNWTEGHSDSRRVKMLGNCMTVDVIAHIFGFITKNKIKEKK